MGKQQITRWEKKCAMLESLSNSYTRKETKLKSQITNLQKKLTNLQSSKEATIKSKGDYIDSLKAQIGSLQASKNAWLPHRITELEHKLVAEQTATREKDETIAKLRRDLEQRIKATKQKSPQVFPMYILNV